MDAQLRELLPFLHDRNPQVRRIALSNLLGHTPKGSSYRDIFFANLQGGGLKQPKENETIRDLKLLCLDQLAIAHDAFRALVNLSDSPLLAAPLSEPVFLGFLVSYIIHPPSVLADLAAMLLSNLTAHSAACTALLKLTVPVVAHPSAAPPFYPPQSRSGTSPPPAPYPSAEPRDVPALPLLVHAFVQGATVDTSQDVASRTRKGELHFLSSVFANISVPPAGRMYFLTPRSVDVLQPGLDGELEYPLSQLIVFTEHIDVIRRGGVTSTIKNCAFHTPSHCALLSLETELIPIPPSTTAAPGINILPQILLPLAGPEEFELEDQENLLSALQFLPDTKKREPDPVLRLTHAETLLLLCTTRWGRDHLRANGVYEILKTMHLAESVDKIAEQVERVVNFLKRDEGPEVEADAADGASVADPRPPVAVPVLTESDEEDSKIEEV